MAKKKAAKKKAAKKKTAKKKAQPTISVSDLKTFLKVMGKISLANGDPVE